MKLPFLLAGGAAAVLLIGLACSSDPDPAPGGTTSSASGGTSSGATSGGTSGATSGQTSSGTTNPAGPGKDAFEFSKQTVKFENTDRIFVLQKPKVFDAAKSYPLILAFHGNPGSAQSMADVQTFLTAGNDAIVAYPQALEPTDATSGYFDWDFGSATPQNPDMKWVQTIPAEIKKTLTNVDTRHVFAFGYSGGGFFVTHFACRFGDVFRAISSHSGGGPDETQFPQKANGCYTCPGGAVATLVTHGKNDTGVDPENASFTANCAVDTNVCNTTTAPSTPDSCVRYEGCPKDKPVELCLIPNQSHDLWGGASAKSWDFFKTLLD